MTTFVCKLHGVKGWASDRSPSVIAPFFYHLKANPWQILQNLLLSSLLHNSPGKNQEGSCEKIYSLQIRETYRTIEKSAKQHAPQSVGGFHCTFKRQWLKVRRLLMNAL